mmetsp:Transcript_36912/g.58039  ORF Transcript_36912/g.58039 Transcript_36912/m.58039 type:complete len:159 (-) Transcript_36912:70-546(-)
MTNYFLLSFLSLSLLLSPSLSQTSPLESPICYNITTTSTYQLSSFCLVTSPGVCSTDQPPPVTSSRSSGSPPPPPQTSSFFFGNMSDGQQPQWVVVEWDCEKNVDYNEQYYYDPPSGRVFCDGTGDCGDFLQCSGSVDDGFTCSWKGSSSTVTIETGC